MKIDLDRVKLIVSEMMNEENDLHADLLKQVKSRVGLNSDTEKELQLIHSARIEMLERVYRKLQSL